MKNNKKGFTLMEMLIVVAIIAILVAIAIPTFTSALEKAKEATDEANIRAWYAEEVIAYMTEDTKITKASYDALDASLNYPEKAELNDKTITYTPKKLNGGVAFEIELPVVPTTTVAP